MAPKASAERKQRSDVARIVEVGQHQRQAAAHKAGQGLRLLRGDPDQAGRGVEVGDLAQRAVVDHVDRRPAPRRARARSGWLRAPVPVT